MHKYSKCNLNVVPDVIIEHHHFFNDDIILIRRLNDQIRRLNDQIRRFNDQMRPLTDQIRFKGWRVGWRVVEELKGWGLEGLTNGRVEGLKGCSVEGLQCWRVEGLKGCSVEGLSENLRFEKNKIGNQKWIFSKQSWVTVSLGKNVNWTSKMGFSKKKKVESFLWK